MSTVRGIVRRKELWWCPNCKENSVSVRRYTPKVGGAEKRVEYCTNNGCGYRLETTITTLIGI